MKRMYQHIDIPGKELSYEGGDRRNSKFWNEGKWNNFINPLIPEKSLDLPFLEIGSNSGLFLKMAEEKGFRHVYGVERQEDRQTTSDWYKESTNSKFKVIKESMDANFDWKKLPRMGVTLISNTHYYMPINDFAETVNSLRNRTAYCIIVSADGKTREGRANHDINSIRGYFNDWEEVGVIENIGTDGDPSPREGMYAIIFKSNLELYSVDEWQAGWPQRARRMDQYKYNALFPATEEFYNKIVSKEDFKIEDTSLYDYYSNRKSSDRSLKYLQYKKELAEDVIENGIMDLIYLDSDGRLKDGISRLSIARALNYKNVIIKKI